MSLPKSVLFLLLLLACSIPTAFSQITATPASGCATLAVSFSGPPGATNIYWNLGPGQGTTNVSSPNAIYPNAGTYNVTYTALVNGSPVNHATQILVTPAPSANFSFQAPSTHCAPMTVTFTGSGGNPGSTFTWNFGDLSPLGNGNSVTHTYNFSNNFIPVMVLVDAITGCTAVATGAGTIHVSNPANINIASSNGFVGCVPPFNTTLNGSGSTSGSPIPGGTLQYSWSMNNGNPNSSTSAIPGLVTFGFGTHTIALTVTDNNQCSTSSTVYIAVVNPTLTATIPGTVCLLAPVPATINTPQSYVNISITSFSTSFGFPTIPNGTTYIDTVCIFSTPGAQQLTLSVQAAGICPSYTLVKNVYVEEVIANFTHIPPGSSCNSPFIVTYSNTSTINTSSGMTFSWTCMFPSNASHTATPTQTIMNNMGNATFTLYQGSLNPYTIHTYFMPNITLIAQSTSAGQCSASIVISHYDTLMVPSAWFAVDKRQGCSPLTVNFRDTTLHSFNYPIPVSNYTWCNGAPGSASATIVGSMTAQFTYTTGTYYPYLIIETINGCRDTSYRDTITVVNSPTVSAAFPSTVCVGVPITINMTGTATSVPSSSVIDNWHVTTDNGFFSGCISNKNPTFHFTHPGVHQVVATAYQAGCKSTATMVPTIQVFGPLGKFQFQTSCANKFNVTFTVTLEDATSAVLNFGHGTPINITGNGTGITTTVITHIYSSTGNYNINLTTFNNAGLCGPYTFNRVVKIRNPSVSIMYGSQSIPALPNALACTKSPYRFTAVANDIDISCGRAYTWFFETPTYTLPAVNCTHPIFQFHNHGITPIIVDPIARDTFRIPGKYKITLRIRDENGCYATDTNSFRISEAVPVLTFAANPACLSNGPIQITNQTQQSQVPPDLIAKYLWRFGDGDSLISTNPYDNPIHQYASVAIPSQVFTIMCVATSTLGCTDTTYNTLQINNPYPNFNASNLFPCLPKNQLVPINFSAMTGYATYSVNYGDPPSASNWQITNNFNNASHAFLTPGIYNPTLQIVDGAGCRSTQQLTITALGQPSVGLKAKPGEFLCIGQNFVLNSATKINVTPITSYQWSTGNIIAPPTLSDSLMLPAAASGTFVYNVTAYVHQNLLCPVTSSLLVTVFDTKANINLNKTIFCLGETITATVTDMKDVAKWQWFFGDLVPQPPIYNTPLATNPVQYHYTTYPSAGANGQTTVTLRYQSMYDDDKGCVLSKAVPIQVIKIDASFNQIDSLYKHCLGLSDVFQNTTSNPMNLTLYYFWKFGDNTSGSGIKPQHKFTSSGVFPVTLMVRDTVYQCSSTAIKNMTIDPLPSAYLSISDTLVCPGDTFKITGSGKPGISGNVKGTLTPGIVANPFTGSSNTFTLNSTIDKNTVFELIVKDENGCESLPAKDSLLIPVKAPSVHSATTVIIGQQIQLDAGVGAGYSFSWTPEQRFLSNLFIPNPVSTSTININYSVTIVDEPLHCFETINTFGIFILPLTTVDVPSAFTPNGDGINDVIFPDGWGIRKLLYFRIFNRWGQLLFESTDLKNGWDGTFEGVPQNMETYVYQVEVETFVDTSPKISKSGTIKLIR